MITWKFPLNTALRYQVIHPPALDIGCSGTDIFSFADGTVTEVNWDDGYGNYIRVSHDGGWSTLYAHCSQTFVQAGQSISKGDKIALAGATGEVTGPHLHFELLHDGIYTIPVFFF